MIYILEMTLIPTVQLVFHFILKVININLIHIQIINVRRVLWENVMFVEKMQKAE